MRNAMPPVLLLSMLSLPCAAQAPLDVEWSARLRHESVSDDAFARDAQATTLRVRAGLRWTATPRLTAFVEGEAVGVAIDDYNAGTGGHADRPAVADPQSAEINQAWLRWRAGATDATVGRQRLAFDNQRWLGNVGWRQNEQTFDAVSLQWQPSKAATLRYAWLDRAHRVASDRALDPLARERRLDGHALDATWTRGAHRLTGYAYLIADRDVAAASTRTAGVRYTMAAAAGTRPFGATLEWAHQRDHDANPLRFSHAYRLVEPAWATRHATLRAGWEHLGGNGRHALQTPLATLHAFNGWADRFTTTPAPGLDDRYLAASGHLARTRAHGPLEWTVAWHDYRADVGGARYGREWNASLGLPFGAHWRALAKLADYRATSYARDTTRLWLQLERATQAK
ncbi:MAG TPA: alginate export family protein [Lysobacter sp.]